MVSRGLFPQLVYCLCTRCFAFRSAGKTFKVQRSLGKTHFYLSRLRFFRHTSSSDLFKLDSSVFDGKPFRTLGRFRHFLKVHLHRIRFMFFRHYPRIPSDSFRFSCFVLTKGGEVEKDQQKVITECEENPNCAC